MKNNILYLRKRYSFTQLDIANYLKIPRRTYLDFENGLTNVLKKKYLISLGLLYDVSIDYLLGVCLSKNKFSCSNLKEIITEYQIDVNELNFLRSKIGISPIALESYDTRAYHPCSKKEKSRYKPR